MNKVYLICDESKSKGFSDNDETFEGEFGVFAGYLLDNENFGKIEFESQKIHSKYSQSDKKIHITDLEKSKMEELRNDVFNLLSENKINCVFEAISVKGYKRSHDAMIETEKEFAADLIHKYSFSKNNKSERLHSDLFEGIFSKAIAYFIDKLNDKFSMTIITDMIDEPVRKEFEQKAKEFLTPFPSTITEKRYNKIEKKPESIKTTFKTNEIESDDFSKIEFEIVSEDNSLTLIADVLANSLSYYILQEVILNADINLNSKNAINKYPIKQLFYGLSSDTNINIVSDEIFGRKNY